MAHTYDITDINDHALYGLLTPNDWEPTAKRIALKITTARAEADECARLAENEGIHVSSQTIDTLTLALERAAANLLTPDRMTDR